MTAKMTDDLVLIKTNNHTLYIELPTKGTDSPLTTHQEVILEQNEKIHQLQGEIAQLTAKHERFVKAAREFHDYIIIHPVKAFDVPDEIYVPFNTALTESEDKG